MLGNPQVSTKLYYFSITIILSQYVTVPGVEWDWNEQKFGTLRISPLYRYPPNKKDLSVAKKSLVVNHRPDKSHLLFEELRRWQSIIRTNTLALRQF